MSTPGGVEFGGSASSSNSKVCVACGEDVSSKPRTKDAKGRYFCKACYDKAIADKHAKREGMTPPKAPPRKPSPSSSPPSSSGRPAPPPFAAPDFGESVKPSVLEHLLDVEPQHAAPALICPACRSAIAAGGTMCTTCGYNMQTGESVRPTRVKLQREPGGTVWPMVVGVMSMVFGIGGIVLYGLFFIGGILGTLRNGFDRSGLIALALTSFPFWLAVWLTRDGFRIIRHNSDGVKWMRFWAMAKLLTFGSCFALSMSTPVRVLDERLAQLPGLEGKIAGSDIKAMLLALMIWFLAWPVFVMIFFFVPRIQSDVEAWD